MNEADFFHVEAVETATPPRANPEGGWCRYVVASERSRIVGRYRGTLKQARRNAEDLVQGLNGRVQTGKVPWAPRARRWKSHAKRAPK